MLRNRVVQALVLVVGYKIGPILRLIIPSLQAIRSPKIITKGYRSYFYLYGNPILLTTISKIQFLITLLSINALNCQSCYLTYKFKYYP